MDIEIEIRIKERIEELNKTRPPDKRITIVGLAAALEKTNDYMFKVIKGKIRPSQKIQFALSHLLECAVEEIFLPTVSIKNLQSKEPPAC
ncbi:MAG: hypothetical protein WA118_08105 [Carboxydocellales bacterium]